jgi:DNA-binding Lrp family transcriptional regulator
MSKLYDNWDKRIFSEIEFNYRISHRAIAKKIKRSKSFVNYRLKKLEDNKIIFYKPLIDYSKLGLQYYRIIIETILDKDEIKRKISDLKLKTVWLVEKYDKENFVLLVLAKNHSDFQDMWNSIYERLSKEILSKDIHVVYCIHHLPSTFFHKDKGLRREYITGKSEPVACAEDELRVLSAITENPIISMQKLEKEIKLSQSKLRYVMKSLEKKGIILAYQTFLNKNTLNIKHNKVFLGFDFTRKNKQSIINALRTYDNVIYITESGYKYDLEFEILSFNDSEIKELIKRLKDNFNIKQIVLSQMISEEKLY